MINIKTKCLALFAKLKQMLNCVVKLIAPTSSHTCTKPIVSCRLFLNKVWDGDLNSLSEKKIYCYQEPHGGIYKTMGLSLIGNEDIEAKLGMNKYFSFVRIDNTCGYCQFSYKSLSRLFEMKLSSLHKNYTIYEFDNQSDFIEWCMSRPKQYSVTNGS